MPFAKSFCLSQNLHANVTDGVREHFARAKVEIGDAGHRTKLRIKSGCVPAGAGMQRGIHMRKITLFVAGVIAGVMISVGTWFVVGTTTPTTALAGSTVDPFAMMAGAKALPTSQYDDYSVVFN